MNNSYYRRSDLTVVIVLAVVEFVVGSMMILMFDFHYLPNYDEHDCDYDCLRCYCCCYCCLFGDLSQLFLLHFISFMRRIYIYVYYFRIKVFFQFNYIAFLFYFIFLVIKSIIFV